MSFDIIIPTWNNLPYLKLAINSIKKYTSIKYKIYVHVNEGKDGTVKWLQQQQILYTFFEKNKGVCEGTNLAAKLGTNKYVVFFNDDMVALPKWDVEIIKTINQLKTDIFLICSTAIEPIGHNPNCIIRNYGHSPAEFQEDKLLSELFKLRLLKPNLISTWSPLIVPRIIWGKVGGYSIEYEPGFGSDPDLCKKMYNIGCRNFIGVGKSIIYHFQSKSTSKIKINNSRKIFLDKHNIELDYFIKNILKRGSLWINEH